MSKLPHSEAFPSDKSLPTSNVFTAAPFKSKAKNKQRPITPNKDDDINKNPERQGYSNLSFNDAVQDNYF